MSADSSTDLSFLYVLRVVDRDNNLLQQLSFSQKRDFGSDFGVNLSVNQSEHGSMRGYFVVAWVCIINVS